MPRTVHACYDDEGLCQDIASSMLSVVGIAQKHKVSSSLVYAIIAGTTRPELKVRIAELLDAEKAAGMRLAKHRARWFMARLVQIAGNDTDIGLKAVLRGLEMAGMATGSATADKQTIEIVLSAMGGNGEPAKKNNRLTGIWNGNN